MNIRSQTSHKHFPSHKQVKLCDHLLEGIEIRKLNAETNI